MQYTSVTLSALALLGASHAAPAIKRQATLPASQETQEEIINLENTIVYLTNDIVQTNHESAVNDYNTAQSLFTGVQVDFPLETCGISAHQITITTAKEAITALNSTQNDLALLSLNLQNTASSQQTLQNDYCAAYWPFAATKNYVFDILGTPENGDSNQAVAASTNSQGYDPVKLGQTYTATEVALEALISALHNIPSGQPSSSQAKTAFTNAENTIATFSRAANASAPHSCPLDTVPGATDSQGAINEVYVVERAVQTAYADTTADNGKKLVDFCTISAYMSATDDYVKA